MSVPGRRCACRGPFCVTPLAFIRGDDLPMRRIWNYEISNNITTRPRRMLLGAASAGHNMLMASPTVDKTSSKPRRKRRWLQFGLPTLLGLVTALCVVLGLCVQRAERQRRTVAFVRSLGGD